MDDLIFTSIMERLQAKVAELRWLDLDFGQLYVAERPPVAFPCVLIDLSYINCETLSGGDNQKITARVTLRVGFRAPGATSAAAPKAVRSEALLFFRALTKIQRALQWWRPCDRTNRLKRRSCVPEQRADGIKCYLMTYECTVLDQGPDQDQDQPG